MTFSSKVVMQQAKTKLATYQNIARFGIGLLLICGAALRTLWSFGGPDWLYWSGNFLFGVFLAIPGCF
jgi:hypothetical protein